MSGTVDDKSAINVETGSEVDGSKEASEKYGTINDQTDMYRMGKTQKLRVSSPGSTDIREWLG